MKKIVTIAEGSQKMMAVLTPVQVEQRLVNLSREIDNAHHDLVEAEVRYSKAKTAYELGVAKVRLSYRGADTKMRVQEVEDMALVANEKQFEELNTSDAIVRAARANAGRVKIQVEITRSVGTSVRASMEG